MNLTNSQPVKPFYKRKWFLFLITIILISNISRCFKDDNNVNPVIEEIKVPELKVDYKSNNENLLKAVSAEKKVKEAIITNANVLYISVVDDGTRRDGYADYMCQLVKDYNSNVNSVKIVKVWSTKDPNRDNSYGVLLGESFCE